MIPRDQRKPSSTRGRKDMGLRMMVNRAIAIVNERPAKKRRPGLAGAI